MLLLFFAFKILGNDWIVYTELYFKLLLPVVDSSPGAYSG